MQVITSYADLMAGTALDNYLIGAAAAKEGFTELNGKLNQDADLTLVNCVSWSSDNSISKIGNRVFVTIGVQITSEQSSGSLIITNIAKTITLKMRMLEQMQQVVQAATIIIFILINLMVR